MPVGNNQFGSSAPPNDFWPISQKTLPCRVCLPGDQADSNCNEVLNLFVLRAKDAAAREEDEEPEDEEEPWLIRWWLLFRESPGLARVYIV